MAIAGFLKVPDVPGESHVEGHEDEIEVHSISFAMAAPVDVGSLARRGRVKFEPLTLGKRYDRSSPYLKKALYDNMLWDAVVLSLVRAVEGETSAYVVVRLADASVAAYTLEDAEAPDRLEEQVTLVYRSIRFTYDGAHEVEFDAVPNR
ncbi:type VI secretion system effector, Hcp1 family [Beutenbergia cavernae DSM 12333]|uniref:Type VI secretion system effector, Hcp1 family n=1 Tax=Beutenbergia cavernae (strain ATCC BAA-8 / DSM 12333 / CCUG 43141 / JCM 11478 / NBRC 16432 / NCIMB 13614 / HKI 0122) TaxID=471853 RepID=C5C6C6_BEUC1|nr:type VI secretion system tube protein Hcp [Beutenbergia cavernae]ACQ80332.1 type VI secretion system effector, Hcp1 family [Beutenbergia cavernae DSM 12333]